MSGRLQRCPSKAESIRTSMLARQDTLLNHSISPLSFSVHRREEGDLRILGVRRYCIYRKSRGESSILIEFNLRRHSVLGAIVPF